MPAIASNVIVESEAFRAHRAGHLELIAEVRGLERKVIAASAGADDKVRSRGQLPTRERMNWLLAPGARWSVTAIGRVDIWPLHRRAAELGGDLRTGLEDTIDLPDGARAASNGELVAALVAAAREAGRAIASPTEARQALGLASQRKETRP